MSSYNSYSFITHIKYFQLCIKLVNEFSKFHIHFLCIHKLSIRRLMDYLTKYSAFWYWLYTAYRSKGLILDIVLIMKVVLNLIYFNIIKFCNLQSSETRRAKNKYARLLLMTNFSLSYYTQLSGLFPSD